ncbi:MAG TPA: hypothetical protein H9867_06430 [Candidatus Corynebacterium gallistercoris]|uniref:Uncharacterized protein n=1 Tax=Candidatus Corynebacterium gallistercoris TaxID=2838530 RepID=A0A9D1RYS3_9CORY|nr:hypothetical protein [Candidatus Corynebacterium gallistercoris]
MRRRIAAVVALVLVVLLLWWIIGAITGGDDNQADTANTAQQTQVSETTTSAKSTESSESAEPSESKTTKASESKKATAQESCTLEDLEITATPGSVSFGADRQPNFFAKISNPTDADCMVDFDDNELKFEVFTMNNYQRVWGDTDCNDPEVTGEVDVPAGESVNYELKAWSKTTSAPGECGDRQPVGAGSYLLYAHVGEKTSQPATFNMG